MKMLFHYNWQVREEWYRWCEEVSGEELLKKRTGGVGSILETLFHIIDTEWSWLRVLRGEEDFKEDFAEYSSLEKVRELDARFRPEVEAFVANWNDGLEHRLLVSTGSDGTEFTDSWGEVMRHVIGHEIHHIGQLSVWSRELGREPVSADLLGRGLGNRR
ncbi:DinB family protein [Planococcus beigongshangi]|uniref:DinB family protein n=1 Tax=Planococcus beigongshangi TaxID=2782536 RepID=UPI00193BC166|nr:DinB family protein [Planococcus beigongshangi]